MTRARIATVGALATLLVINACDYDPDKKATYDDPADQLYSEFKGEVDTLATERVVEISKAMVLDVRAAGVDLFIRKMQAALAARGLDGSSLGGIQDFTLGDPLAGVGEYEQSGAGIEQSPVGKDNVNRKHFECPPIGEKGTGISCAWLIDNVLEQVRGQMTVEMKEMLLAKARELYDNDPVLQAQTPEFRDFAEQYLRDMASSVHAFGMDVAAIKAEYLLRYNQQCDEGTLDGEEIAHLRGVEDGLLILREMLGRNGLQMQPQGEQCKKIGMVGRETEIRIKRAIDAYVSDHRLCPDTSDNNPQVQAAEKARREGIQRAITAHTTTIWVGTIRKGIKRDDFHGDTVINLDGCEAKDQIRYTTSPLVIDLDGDGLELTTSRVGFDLRASGQPQSATWAGKREGFLALDLDGNGRITSGRELFGDRSDCGADRCADGAAALAHYDRPAKGGNADGRIDARDAIFDALQIWVDANHDGRTQAGELSGLREHGIKALSLAANYKSELVPAGKISLTLSVETENGPRRAYDVWFKNTVKPLFPTAAY